VFEQRYACNTAGLETDILLHEVLLSNSRERMLEWVLTAFEFIYDEDRNLWDQASLPKISEQMARRLLLMLTKYFFVACCFLKD